MNTLIKIFVGAVAAYLFAMTILLTFLMSDFFIPPVVPMQLELFNDKIKSDEQIKYLAVFRRNTPCLTQIQRFVVFKDRQAAIEQFGSDVAAKMKPGTETEFIGFRDMFVGIIRQGDDDVIRTISTMDHPPLPKGKYILRIYVVSMCNLITRLDQYPEAPFEVVE